MKEGLGVIKLRVQNEALSLKNLHKFFNKADLSWVQLIWAQYYQNGKVPSRIAKSSFWWRGMLRLLAQYIGLAYGVVGSGHTILFWKDLWNGQMLEHTYPELFSFAINGDIALATAKSRDSLQNLFITPLLEVAYDQFCELHILMQSIPETNEDDKWTYI
jgi:hypothetical protein